ncbi:MAG: DUF1097 domain-containing protein, partial [Eubacteriales bacterium]|nr:DUF1097 domain-containing protein [Eubacteriales bacterium]
MSKKTIVLWSIWVSVLSALFNWLDGVIPIVKDFNHGGGAPWILFVCLAVFFAGGFTSKQVPGIICSAAAGLAWAQVDFILMTIPGFAAMGGFLAITVGTAITMIIHIMFLGNTPFGVVPFIFAGVCLTFATGGHYSANPIGIVGLGLTLLLGICLC